jgi:hypothetical protein
VIQSKGGAFWNKQVELALARRATYEPWWDANLAAYAPINRTPESYGAEISTNRTFTLTERKKADLFYQRPEVTLNPTPLMEGQPPIGPDGQPVPNPLAAHEEIINEKLGPDGVDVAEMMDDVMFDLICTQAFGCTELGYESFTIDVPQMQPVLDPLSGQAIGEKPAVDAMGQPVMVPVPVKQHCFWEHFSGKQMLIPHSFRSTKWDKAPWLGRQFELPLTAANRKKYQIPDEFEGNKGSSKQHYEHGGDTAPSEDTFTGAILWYRSMLFREDVFHPDHFSLLVMVDGIPEPVIEMDSPHQTLDGRGQLTPDSLIGNPIHPFSVRKLADTAYPSSDGTMIRPLERELNVFRTQQTQFRDAVLLKWGFRASAIPQEAMEKIVRSPIGGMIPLPDEAFPLENNLVELPQGSMPRESFIANDYIDNDIARTLGIDAQQLGVQGDSRTATADQLQQANANARIEKERGILLKRYLQGVTKYSTLVQRYFPVEEAAQIVGQARAAVWDQWRKVVPSALAFTAMPDSALRVDQAVDRKSAVDLYSFLANDPYIQKGRPELLKGLLRKHHINPEKIVFPPDPPKPEPPKLSIAIKGEDFVGPQAPVIFEIAKQLGLEISAEAQAQTKALGALLAVANAQAETAQAQAKGDTQHGGKLAPQESLSKHAADTTGGMQGIGGPAAMGAGGGLLQ